MDNSPSGPPDGDESLTVLCSRSRPTPPTGRCARGPGTADVRQSGGGGSRRRNWPVSKHPTTATTTNNSRHRQQANPTHILRDGLQCAEGLEPSF